jgi:5-methylcytosine-specific restriction protein A
VIIFECQKCKRRGKVSKATCVHHKKHLKDYPELALVDSNLISLCYACHNEEHPEKLASVETEKRKQITPERW